MKNPPEAQLYTAEFIRMDISQPKPDMLGFFPGNMLAIPLTEDSEEPSKTLVMPIQNFNILIWVQNSSVGALKSINIKEPQGSAIFPAPIAIDSADEVKPGAMNAVIQLPGFPVAGFGKYIVEANFTKHTYSFSFNIEKIISPTGQKIEKPKALAL